MKTIEQCLVEAVKNNVLWDFMGWDVKHGPTQRQLELFNEMFGELALGEESELSESSF